MSNPSLSYVDYGGIAELRDLIGGGSEVNKEIPGCVITVENSGKP